MSAPTCDGCSPDWHWRCTECEATALRAENSLLKLLQSEVESLAKYYMVYSGYAFSGASIVVKLANALASLKTPHKAPATSSGSEDR